MEGDSGENRVPKRRSRKRLSNPSALPPKEEGHAAPADQLGSQTITLRAGEEYVARDFSVKAVKIRHNEVKLLFARKQ